MACASAQQGQAHHVRAEFWLLSDRGISRRHWPSHQYASLDSVHASRCPHRALAVKNEETAIKRNVATLYSRAIDQRIIAILDRRYTAPAGSSRARPMTWLMKMCGASGDIATSQCRHDHPMAAARDAEETEMRRHARRPSGGSARPAYSTTWARQLSSNPLSERFLVLAARPNEKATARVASSFDGGGGGTGCGRAHALNFAPDSREVSLRRSILMDIVEPERGFSSTPPYKFKRPHEGAA